MAIFKNSLLGSISGKAGNVIVRRRNGKDVVYSVPETYNVSQSEKALLARRKFANTVEFAKAVNSLPQLANVWKSAKVKGTNSFQKIIKYNSPYISNSGLSVNCSITPNGIGFTAPSILLDENNLKFAAVLLEEAAPTFDQLVIILYFPQSPSIRLISLTSDSELEQIDNSISGTVAYNEKLCGALLVSDASIAFAAFLSKRVKSKETFWSNTSAFDLTKIKMA